MQNLTENELKNIVKAYGFDNLVFDFGKQVGPDESIYIFHDDKDKNYALFVADFLGGYDTIELPFEFEFDDDYPYKKISFRALKRFSYTNGAEAAASGYVDDDHFLTKASSGDVCMLFECSDLKAE